ncbi:MAG TPA: hypothetical protein VLJ17_24645 [Xanthobacteraceae bacterium]|nr:hypothetical protein [Xanthobacteraceae bacterium]
MNIERIQRKAHERGLSVPLRYPVENILRQLPRQCAFGALDSARFYRIHGTKSQRRTAFACLRESANDHARWIKRGGYLP